MEKIKYEEYLKMVSEGKLSPDGFVIGRYLSILPSTFLFGDEVMYDLKPGDRHFDGRVLQWLQIQKAHGDKFMLKESVAGWWALDVGCREFHNFDYFSQKKVNILGIDLCDMAFELNKIKGYACPILRVDAHEMDRVFPEEFFNLILAYHCLEHMYDRAKVLRNCYTLLKPGGYLYLNVPIEKSSTLDPEHLSPITDSSVLSQEGVDVGFKFIVGVHYTLDVRDPNREYILEHPEGFLGLFKKEVKDEGSA